MKKNNDSPTYAEDQLQYIEWERQMVEAYNMKWNNKHPDPKRGDKRIVNAFLFFPKCINGRTRWLEKARWQEVLAWYSGEGCSPYWIPVEWKNK